jgi:hypothetical protein
MKLTTITFAILAVLCCNCGTCRDTTMKQLNALNETTRTAIKEVRPILKKRCRLEVEMCTAKKPPIRDPNKCPKYLACDRQRGEIYRVANGIHVSVATAALAISVGDQSGAAAILVSATSAGLRLKNLIQKTKLLDGI